MKKTLMLLALASFAGQATTLESKLQECAQRPDNQLRLACYDTLAEQAREEAPTAEQRFGLEHKQTQQGAAESLTALVADAKRNAYGKLSIRLDNGQLWKQTDGGRFSLEAGDKVVLDKGALGSVFLSKAGETRRIKVKRIK
ncbi:hypothetical protein [Gallaecimonas sp. GXIMD4217]|uniref:hypothetical protein n=1 Tax=Gallaecimonas sp. GXIMD4217 TaxID=3131927 RepID=UPI00311B0B02